MLTDAQQRLRAHKITASLVPILMSGDEEKILHLWREQIGEAEPEDLRNVWPVQLGSHLEPFILDWHQRKTGMEITERGTFHQHPAMGHVGCTLDGYRAADDCVLEVKVAGGWQRLDDIISFYVSQVLTQMRCRECKKGALLICHGGAEPREIPILPNPDYEAEMWARIAAFQLCVLTLTPPSPVPRIIPPEQWRSLDLNSLAGHDWPNWAHEVAFNLDQWRDLRPQALEFENVAARIKSILPDDVGRLACAGLTIRRNRRGAITIQETI